MQGMTDTVVSGLGRRLSMYCISEKLCISSLPARLGNAGNPSMQSHALQTKLDRPNLKIVSY